MKLRHQAAEYGARIVSEEFQINVTPADVLSPSRRYPVTVARGAAFAWLRAQATAERPMSYARVALTFAPDRKVNHATALVAIRKFCQRFPRRAAELFGEGGA